MGEFLEDGFCGFEVDAAVGDALAVGIFAAFFVVLASSDKVAFEHDAGDAFLSGGDLLGEDMGDFRLACVVFVAVAVAAVDDEVGWQFDSFEFF